MELSGIFPPLTTPFENERVSGAKLAENIARYERHGLAGYLLLGSTGEAAYLEEGEKVEVWKAARVAIPSGKVMIALVLTPHYFRSHMTADVLLRHYSAVADASPIPLLLYNVPKFTGLEIPPAVIVELAGHERIIGLKDSSGNLGWMLDVLHRVPSDFKILCGSAFVFQPALEAGAVGGILAVADALPELFVQIFERTIEGDSESALELQKDVLEASRFLAKELGIPGLKASKDDSHVQAVGRTHFRIRSRCGADLSSNSESVTECSRSVSAFRFPHQ